MQVSEYPTLGKMNTYAVMHTDIYLKSLLLQNEAALKQQREQKHSNKLTVQEISSQN